MTSFATLSIDLDNAWSYLKTAGHPDWESFPSYLDLLVPRALSLLAEHELRITWFVVGQDAALDKNRTALSSIAAGGHEIGNHSFHHEGWKRYRTAADAAAEISLAERAILAATGRKPRGYRAPGYGVSRPELEAMALGGYVYDASTLPTFVGPLARTYYFAIATMPRKERSRRAALFGTYGDALLSLKPYRWQVGEANVLELPVTTMPLTRTPIHFSYLLSLAAGYPAVARRYFQLALNLCRRLGVTPSLLLHPLDLLGGDDLPEFDFFPGMRQPSRDKLAFLSWALGYVTVRFDVVSLGRYVDSLGTPDTVLPVRSADSLRT